MATTLEQEISRRKFEYASISEDYLKLQPCYFNSGCCCFDNGAITGLEISEGVLRLVEWKMKEEKMQRIILEEAPLEELQQALESKPKADRLQ
jgi:hypothetical protein